MLFIQFFQVAAQVLALEVMVDACICFLDLFERPAMQAVTWALSDAEKRRILVEEKVQAFNLYQTKERAAGRSRRSKKQSKAVRASTGGERSETPPAAALKVPAAKQHPAAIAKREAEREAAQEARQAERQARLEAAAAAAKHEAAEAAARLEAAEAERSECEQAVLWLCSRPDPAAAAQAFNMYNAAARAARVARAARATHAARAARAALTVEVTEVQAGQAEEEEAAFKARELVRLVCEEEEEWAAMALPPLLLPPPLLPMQAKLAEGERSAIAEWLEAHDTSPATGVTLKSKLPVPNPWTPSRPMHSIMARILLPDFDLASLSSAPSSPEAAPSPSSKVAVSPVSVMSSPHWGGEARCGHGGRGGRGGFGALGPAGAAGWMKRLDDVW